jgi:hypothetical protein
MATFIYKDGDSKQDVTITIDNVKRIDEDSPWIGMDFSVETPDFTYSKSISIDDFELEDLSKTFERFINGEIKDYYIWNHIEDDIEILFLPKEDQVTIKVSFVSFCVYSNGFFLDLYSSEEYMRFHAFIKEAVKDIGSRETADAIPSRPCLVGNIVGEHIKGDTGETVNGTKHFSAGTKVYLARQQWGDGYENAVVIGKHRGSFRYSEIIMDTKFITNYRYKRVYDPTVIKMMNESKYIWWNDDDEKWIISLAKAMNESDSASPDTSMECEQIVDSNKSEEYSPYLDTEYYVVWVKYDDIETFSDYCYVDLSHSIVTGEKVMVERNNRFVPATVTDAKWARRRELDYPPEKMSREISRINEEKTNGIKTRKTERTPDIDQDEKNEKPLVFDIEQYRVYWGILPASFRPDLKKDIIVGRDALCVSKDCPKEIKKQLIEQFPEYIERQNKILAAPY